MKRRGGFLRSLGIFILCLTAPATLICAPLIIANFRKTKTVNPDFRVQNECVQYTQDKGKTWDTIITLSELMEKCGVTGQTGIKSVTEVPEKTDNTKTTYKITFHDNTVFEFEVKNGEDGKKGENGKDGRGIKSIYKDTVNSTDEKSVYVIMFDDNSNSTYSFEILNGADGTNGTNGENGVDGREVEFQTTATHIQWRYKTEDNSETWKNLVELNTLKGQDGENGGKGDKGEDGQSSYVYIKYAAKNPKVDNTAVISDEPNAWMGIYVNTKDLEDKTDASKYTWYNIKGQDGENGGKGDKGEDGQSSYVYIKYAAKDPTVDNTVVLSDEPNAWMGIYVNTKDLEDKTDASKYTWYNIKGQDGTGVDVDRYTLTYEYGVAGDFFKVDADTNALKTTETVKSTQWIDSLPEIKDAYEQGFKGWFIQGTDVQIAEYDFIGRDTILEPRFHFNEYAPAGLYENGEMIKNWAQLTTDGTLSVSTNEQKILGCDTSVQGDLILEDGILSIDVSAFNGCTGLTTITIPSSVTTIGEAAFYVCNGLTEITIPNKVTTIENKTFFNCESLTSITIPSNVTSIGSSAFSGCTGLTTITIPNSITTIGTWAFYKCSGLTTITIPNSVTTIGDDVFYDCTGLKTVVIDSETIANGLTSSSSQADLLSNATTVYIKTGLNVSNSTYLNTYFAKVDSNKDGYDMYVRATVYTVTFDYGGYENYFETTPEVIIVKSNEWVTNLPQVESTYASVFKGWFIQGTDRQIRKYDFIGGNVTLKLKLDFVNAPAGLYSPTGFTPWRELVRTGIIKLSSSDSTEIEDCDSSIQGDLILEDGILSIGSSAFAHCTGLTTITIPNSVTTIGKSAFEGCTGLTTITIPNSVTTIEGWAFYGCTGLTSITIPNSVTTIGEAAFSGCSGLESIVVEEGNTKYNSRENCNAIIETATNTLIAGCKNTAIQNSVTKIGGFAFGGCYGLTSITIPNSVTTIGEAAFGGCTGLTEITIPSSVISIGFQAFSGCTGLTEINIPNSVTTIGEAAFYGCTGLIEITIPNKVTTIEIKTFFDCTSLTSITIPSSVTAIGESAFAGCSNLKTVVIDSETIANGLTSSSSQGDLLSNATTVYIKTGLNISNSTYLKEKCSKVDSDKSGYNKYASGVYTVTFDYGGYENYFATTPETITVKSNEGITNLPEMKAAYAERFKGWFIQGTDKQISNNDVIGGNVTLVAILNAGLYSTEGFTPWSELVSTGIIKLSSSDSTKIEKCNSSIQGDLILEDGILIIGDYAFSGCTGLTTITIPNSVTTIGNWVFNGCVGLTTTTIPNSVTTIGDWAFSGCAGLTTITIPSSATTIGEYAFRGCTGLESITVDSRNSVYRSEGNCLIKGNELLLGCKNSTIPSSVTTIGMFAFYGCTGLTKITIPSNVTSIGNYAFFGCTGLTEITIPSNVTSIGNYAFYKCTGLTEITIPNSVTTIGNNAFSYCTGLKIVVIDSETIANGLTSSSSQGDLLSNATTVYIKIGLNVSNSTYLKEKYSTVDSDQSGYNKYASNVYTVTFDYGGYENYFATTPETITVKSNEGITNLPEMKAAYAERFKGWFIQGTDKQISNNDVIGGNVTLVAILNAGLYSTEGFTPWSQLVITGIIKLSSSDSTKIEKCNSSIQGDLILEDGILSIGDSAFKGCEGLTTITIPSDITSIGYYAFYECTGLTEITIPSSVTIIGDFTFSGCTGLTKINIPSSVTTIGASAFNRCRGLTEINIPNGVTTIGNSAFSGCTGLTEINISNGVTSIGNFAFSRCAGLTEINIPNSVTTIGSMAFYYCTELKTVVIDSATISNGLTSSESQGYLLSNATTVYIKRGLNISSSTYLKEKYSKVDSDKSGYNKYDSGVYTVTFDYVGLETYFETSPSTITVKSNEGITNLPEIKAAYAERFKGWFIQGTDKQIRNNDVIDGNVTLVARLKAGLYSTSGFTPWSELVSTGIIKLSSSASTEIEDCDQTIQGDLILEDGILSIGDYAFEGCTGLTKINIPNSVTTIGDYAFEGCTGLTTITIPSNVTLIDYCAFHECAGLENITVDSGNSVYRSEGNCLIRKSDNILLAGCKTSVIPNSVTTIGNNAFYGRTGLTEINIPSSVTKILDFAFRGCTGLTEINISSGVTYIGWGAFYECTGLTTITIPNSVTEMVNHVFYNCTGLTEINISNSVTKIYTETFSGCTRLTTITIPSNVTTIGNLAFKGCTGLTEIIIPSSVTSIGGGAFYGCTGLTDINIPSSVTSIGYDAFRECSGLTEITIPSSVTSIGPSAFEGCTILKTVVIDRETVANGLTSSDSQGYLLEYATTVYIKSGLTVSSSTYLTSNFTKQTSSDRAGYNMYIKNT